MTTSKREPGAPPDPGQALAEVCVGLLDARGRFADPTAADVERLRHEAVERERVLSRVKTQRDTAENALREWVDALLDLREWLHDKSTPRDDAETDRRYDRVDAAEKAARAVLGARPGNDATKEE